MAEQPDLRRFRFTATTAEELRDELNEFSEWLGRDFQTDSVTLGQIIWIPTPTPTRAAEVTRGTMFVPEELFGGGSQIYFIDGGPTLLTTSLRSVSPPLS